MDKLLRVEFHCHTEYSGDCLTRLEGLVETCRQKGIDRLVVTDHNTIAGAVRAREIAPELVIVGEEIRTEEGEFLAAYVTEEVPPGLPAAETLARLRDQGAFVSVAHPFDRLRNGRWRPETMAALFPQVDAIEIFNARCLSRNFNREAEAYAQAYSLHGTVGSDAHTLGEVGKATMLLPAFDSAEGLRIALPEVQYDRTLSGPWVHFWSRYAVWRKKRGWTLT
jgi:predicted metal-dependent phosphoesterase TrpH